MTRWIAVVGLILIFLVGCSANIKNNTEDDGQDVFGVVEYQIDPQGTLTGRWTIPDFKGQVGTEIATGGTPGRIEGEYRVVIYDYLGNNLYQGKLRIDTVGTEGEVYSLTWTSAHDSCSYTGLGLMAGPDRLAANYRNR